MESVHLHRSASPGIVVMLFKRDDSTAICSSGIDARLEIAEETLRKLKPLLALWDC